MIRLPLPSALWTESIREALVQAPRLLIVGMEEELARELHRSGLVVSPWNGVVHEEDALLVPMHPVESLVFLVDRLRGPGGCPWDQVQTHETLKRCLLEETYEVLEAIDTGDANALEEELGDLLLQPVMHGQIAEGFDTASVARRIVDKLVRRHPHVFGDAAVSGTEEVLTNWDTIKATEKGEPRSILAGIPTGMASLLRAYEVSKRAARQGFEWPDLDSVWLKLDEEIAELKAAADPAHQTAEVGDLLFTVVNLARWMGIEPEDALRQMLNRFIARFQTMETLTEKELKALSPEEWDTLWNRAKELERARLH